MGLWIKNEDGSIEKAAGGGGGGGGPHNHADYALVEHDHDEFTHDHDYLPLTGGTLTGDLQVEGQTLAQSDTQAKPAYSFTSDPDTGMYRAAADAVGISARGLEVCRFVNNGTDRFFTTAFVTGGAIMHSGGAGSAARPAFTFINDSATGMYRKGTHQIGFAVNGVLVASIDAGGVTGRIVFNVAEDIDTAEVLDRAETATLPPEPETDEGGNQTNAAEVEAHDTVELFDVVTALLAKVKQLSAEIEELKKGA